MAVDTQKLQILLEAKGVKLTKNELKSLNKTVNDTGNGLGKFKGQLLAMGGAFFAAQGIIAGMQKSIQVASQFEGVSRGFNNLAKSSGFSAKAFDKLKSATDGTVDSLTLMKQANNAMLLGIAESDDQMADMFDVAQRLGQSLGVDTTNAVESLVTGLGRQSKLMLDNLGIMVDTEDAYQVYADSVGKTTENLTDAEKKQAFVNAAMEQANVLVAGLGDEQLTSADKLNQLNTTLLDTAKAFGDLLMPLVVPLAKGLELIALGASAVIKTFQQLDFDALDDGAEKIDMLEMQQAALALTIIEVGGVFREVLGQTTIYFENQSSETNRLIGDWFNLEKQIVKTNKSIADSKEPIKETQTFLQVQLKKVGDLWKEQEKQAKKNADAVSLGAVKQGMAYKNSGQAAQDAASQVLIAEAQKVVAQYISSIFASVPFPFNLALAAGASAAAGSLMQGAVGEMSKIKFAADGMDEIVTSPTPIIAGEAGPEQVTITPLGGVGDSPQGGSNVSITLSGNVLTQDFVEGELAEAITEAVRRGNDFGMA